MKITVVLQDQTKAVDLDLPGEKGTAIAVIVDGVVMRSRKDDVSREERNGQLSLIREVNGDGRP